MRDFGYLRAQSLGDALSAIAGPAAIVAGGTTLIDLVKLDVLRPVRLVDINRIGLDQIEDQPDGGLKIGALVRNSDLARDPRVRQRYAVLSEAILSGASAQLRNLATTAGNLMQRTRCPYYRDNVSACNKREPGSGCAAMEGLNRSHAILGGSDACVATHPSDMCVALATLDAVVEIQSADGNRELPFEQFHLLPGDTPDKEFALKPGEIVTAVTLPGVPDGCRSWYVKARDRESFEFALASAAVRMRFDGTKIAGCRVALGGVGTKPWRAKEAEAVLMGAEASDERFRQAAEAALAGARLLEHNGFKAELAKRVLVRTLQVVAEGPPEPRRI